MMSSPPSSPWACCTASCTSSQSDMSALTGMARTPQRCSTSLARRCTFSKVRPISATSAPQPASRLAIAWPSPSPPAPVTKAFLPDRSISSVTRLPMMCSGSRSNPSNCTQSCSSCTRHRRPPSLRRATRQPDPTASLRDAVLTSPTIWPHRADQVIPIREISHADFVWLVDLESDGYPPAQVLPAHRGRRLDHPGGHRAGNRPTRAESPDPPARGRPRHHFVPADPPRRATHRGGRALALIDGRTAAPTGARGPVRRDHRWRGSSADCYSEWCPLPPACWRHRCWPALARHSRTCTSTSPLPTPTTSCNACSAAQSTSR